jgi:hypothetical protein
VPQLDTAAAAAICAQRRRVIGMSDSVPPRISNRDPTPPERLSGGRTRFVIFEKSLKQKDKLGSFGLLSERAALASATSRLLI